MTLSTSSSALDTRFSPFLFATIREDPDDTHLTVLSVLARRGVDPWKEAERLAQLPGDTATGVLADWIGAVPNFSQAPLDSGAIASRLVTLLPACRAHRNAATGGARHTLREVIAEPGMFPRVLLYLMFIALLFISQWAMMRHRAAMHRRDPVAVAATTKSAEASAISATPRRTQTP